MEDLIEAEGPKLAGHENLMSIKGIGPVSAAVLLSAIGKIEDFDYPGKLAAYLGLVPRIQNSKATTRNGEWKCQISPAKLSSSPEPAVVSVRVPGAN